MRTTVTKPATPTVSPSLIRQFFDGLVNRSTLPPLLLRQLEAIQRRVMRQNRRWMKRENKAFQYRAIALQGGGKHEVARRLRQLAA